MAIVSKSSVATVLVVLLVVCGGYYVYEQTVHDKAQAAATTARPAVPVTVAISEARDVPVFVRGLGNVQAFKTVAVKTRVDGQIVRIDFQEGQEVKEGDPLFQIDPRPFQAMVDQAQANKTKNEAQLEGAQLDLERYGKLIGSGFQSRQSYDQQKATVDSLKGAIAADQAAIDTAKLNLAYSSIRAPIDGRTGQRLIDLGNLVQTSQSTTLVTITQVKPIFVNFTIPQFANHNLRKNQAKEALTVYAYSADESYKLVEGRITLVDNQIDTATGTLRLKGEFANAVETLWPGEFVAVRLRLAMRKGAITVPERAVMQGAQGPYAYVIKADNTAERRPLDIEATEDGIAIVGKGIALGETIVVDGQYRLTPGSKVRIDPPAAGVPATPPAPKKSG